MQRLRQDTSLTSKDESSKGLAYRVVNDLIQKFQGKNHLLYVDIFYTSPELLVDLLKKGVYCTGTVRSNRKTFPKNLIPCNKSAQIGSYRFATCSSHQLTAVWWKDRRDVYAISTLHKKSVVTVLKRPKGSKEKQNIPCPEMINDYNQFIGE